LNFLFLFCSRPQIMMGPRGSADDWELLEPVKQKIETDEDLQQVLARDRQDNEERQAERIRKDLEAKERQALLEQQAQMRKTEEEEKWYKYEELPDRECFRLLRLSASETEDAIPECALVKFDLGSCDIPSYRAVSYTWNNDAKFCEVQVKKKKLKVRENLNSLLRYLRHDKYDCWLWIDAMCIDQTSDTERNHQVKLMGQIYQKANYVVAWLGAFDAEVDVALDFVSQVARDGFESSYAAYPKKASIIAGTEGHTDDTLSSKDRTLLCFEKLLNLRYWTRKWIIQEVILANSVVLHLGDRTLAMEEFDKFLDRINEDSSHSHNDWTDRGALVLARHRKELHNGVQQQDTSLKKMMYRYQKFDCTVPCDHVYALFNLIGEHRKFLEIDYRKTPLGQCQAILRFMVDHESLSPYELLSTVIALHHRLELRTGELMAMIVREMDHDLWSSGRDRPLRSRLLVLEALSTGVPFNQSFSASSFDLGEILSVQESSMLQELRRHQSSLCATGTIPLRKVNGLWQIVDDKPATEKLLDVSPFDLSCFKVKGTKYCGLGTKTVQDGDRLWRFKNTNLSFIVRPVALDGNGTGYNIVGRAIFHEDQEVNALLDQRIEEMIAGPTGNVPQEQRMLLKLKDIHKLAFWADSLGPEDNPFHSMRDIPRFLL
jgi:Heterokaryon incompatibility protein (HET)